MKTHLLTLASVLIPFFSMSAPAQSQPPAKAISGKVVKCPMPLAANEVDGKTVICGQIKVPENWNKPNGKLITLTYARKMSFNQSAIADPIIFFAGGPGGSVLAYQGSSSFDFSFLRQTRDVIVWDQRGNRYSEDLRCPQNVQVPNAAAIDAALKKLGEPKFTVRSNPEAILAWTRQVEVISGTARCTAYFKAQGRDVSQYNTANTVRDAIALMDHLNYPVYNLFGISYGTQVTLAIMDYYKKNPSANLPPIRSAVIDGVYPQNVSSVEEALTAPYNILRVFTDCEADTVCGAAYPQIKQRTIDLLARLEASPIKDKRGKAIALKDVVEVLHTAVQLQPELIPYLPRLVNELAQGQTATYAVLREIIGGQVTILPKTSEATNGVASNPLNPITSETTALAADLRAIANRLDRLGKTTSNLAGAIEEAKTLSRLYIGVLNRYLIDSSPEERNKFSDTVINFFASYPEQQNRAGLLRLSNTLTGIVAGELSAITNQMSEAEVRTVWRSLTDDKVLQRLQTIDVMTNMVVKCNDRGASFKIDRALQRYRAFPAPQLIDSLELPAYYQARCEIFGSAVPEYSVLPPVSSDLPTLVMNGGRDHATPVEYGELAFKTLSNAKIVTVPMTDHGVVRYSKCARDIAHTFFLYPNAKLDTSCVKEFRPVFVLPKDPLPQAKKP